MRKKYPYLEEPYVYNLNEEQQKKSILGLIDDFINQRQYVNMTLLDWHENPLKEIQGIISSGSISKDGSSSVRRSCSLSCSVSKEEYNIDSMEMDFALNKKIFIEIGIKNETDYYSDYPIFWFPQGVFYIDSFSINSSTSSAVNLSINLKDKMCLLNGTMGGTLPATVQFDTMTTQLADGTITEQKVLYYNIITELVHHWGEEDLNNIIIQDVPLRIRRVMQWNNSKDDIFLGRDDEGVIQLYTEQDENGTRDRFSFGDRVGYVYDDFVPTSEVTGAAGDSVCTILDTIKDQLGNYEYFYDVFGIFHFREIKNYLNINQSSIILQETGNPGRHINLQEGQFLLDSNSEKQYLIETTNSKNSYVFDSNHNITSISVTPNYNNIKNDFIVDGIRQSDNSNNQFLLRYRLVIDDKPEIVNWITVKDSDGNSVTKSNYGEFNNVLYYTYPEYSNGKIINEVNKLGFWYDNWNSSNELELPAVGNMDQIYRMVEDGENVFYLWTGAGYHKLYLKDDTIDASQNTDWLFVESVQDENIENAETKSTSEIIDALEGMISFIQGAPWWKVSGEEWPFFSVTLTDQTANKDIEYKSYNEALNKNKIETLNKMKEFFQNYINILPFSSISAFLEYEKLPNKENVEVPMYSTIQAIESLLLDKVETLKTKEEIIDCIKQYLDKTYVNTDSSLTELHTELPQDISDERFFRRYPNLLNLSSLLDYLNNNDRTVYEDADAVKNYLQSVIDELLEITDPEKIYQLIYSLITEWTKEENWDINYSIESLLDYLVGSKDVLNPLKYTNYDDLTKIYITDDKNSNSYNHLEDALQEFLSTAASYNSDKYSYYESDYLFEEGFPDPGSSLEKFTEYAETEFSEEIADMSDDDKNSFIKDKWEDWKENFKQTHSDEYYSRWGNKEGEDFLKKSNSKGAFPLLRSWNSKKESKKEEIDKHKNDWPQNLLDLSNLYDTSDYGIYVTEIYQSLNKYFTTTDWSEWLSEFNIDSFIDMLNIIDDQLKVDWNSHKNSSSPELSEEEKDWFQNAYMKAIKNSLFKNRKLLNDFEKLNMIIENNRTTIDKFYDQYQSLYPAIEKAIESYNLRSKLAIANQATSDDIKFKPIIYSSSLKYPDENNGNILGPYYTFDWRTYLYLYGQAANVMGTDPGPYFSDLEAFWPYEYNLNRDKQCFLDELKSTSEVQYKQLTNGNFFFDIIDANSSTLGEFSVKNIGRRTDVVNDENINCLFEPEIPDIVFLNMDNPDANWSENTTIKELRSAEEIIDKLEAQRQECINNNQPYVQASDEIYNSLTTGRYLSDAYEQIKYELFAHLKYQKVVSITALPAYYLEPNSRVTLRDYSTNIYGDYMIQNIGLTLGPGANMAVTLNEVSERL